MLYYNKDNAACICKEGTSSMKKKAVPVIQSATELKQYYEQLVRHDYLEDYIDDTRPDENELWFVYSILIKREPTDRAIAITLAWGYVHAGLAIHELVSLHNKNDDTSKKKRQLNVLAGDFYSALYYQSLAGVNAVDMIELFGSTLQEIYEQKMAVYMDKEALFQERLQQSKAIESLLLTSITKKLNITDYDELVRTFFFYKRLCRDEQEAAEGKLSPLRLSLRNGQHSNVVEENMFGEAKKVEWHLIQEEAAKHHDEVGDLIRLLFERDGGI